MTKQALAAAAILMLGMAGATAGELPSYDVGGFPITPHQMSVLGLSGSVRERPAAPMLLREGILASPHQIAVLSPRSGATAQSARWSGAAETRIGLGQLNHDRAFEYYGKRDNDRAIANFNAAIRIDPRNADAFYGRGNAWSEKLDNVRAFADYNHAIRLDPNHAAALNNRGVAWLTVGQNDRAVADFSAAIRIDPRDADYYNNRGNAWHLNGDNDRAIADLDEAIRLNPRDPCPLYNRGNAWQAKGDRDRAFADYDEAIRLSPNYRCWGVKRKTFAPSQHYRS